MITKLKNVSVYTVKHGFFFQDILCTRYTSIKIWQVLLLKIVSILLCINHYNIGKHINKGACTVLTKQDGYRQIYAFEKDSTERN